MNAPIEFNAPWSAALRRSSVLVMSVLGIVMIASFVGWQRSGEPLALFAAAAVLMAVVGCALCQIRGYALSEREIVVKRLGWTTRLPLDGLIAVTGDNEAMLKSVRLLGNGGALSYSGYFWNRKIGRYRALATDPSRAVLLRYAKSKVVITPDDPQRFIVRARTTLQNRNSVWS